jgi:RNA-directed DNA polymerase
MESMKAIIAKNVLTKQAQIALNAKRLPEVSFTSLAYHMDIGWMYEAYRQTRKDGAVGVDGITAMEYEKDLNRNLEDLLERAKSGRYRAAAVRRTYIPKGEGKELRPLGIPTLEDKILQRAIKMLIEPVYEQDFYEFSYGFRPKRSQHQALEKLWKETMDTNGWIIDLDIRKYFDSIDHKKLQEVIKQRVKDGVITRLIGKWLNAGIMEEGNLYYAETGTPQGGVISPLLSNIYLHEVMDKWLVNEVNPRMRGKVFLIRYADDMVMGFEYREDAGKVMKVLPKRFEKYGLAINSDKTKLVKFDRPKKKDENDKNRSTIDFLGFTHYWCKTRKGYYIVKRKTAKDRLKRAINKVYKWCKGNRHKSIKEQYESIKSKVNGHYSYYGIKGNYRSLGQFYWNVIKAWQKWLGKRSNLKSLNWEKFSKMLRHYPVPQPKIMHSIYSAKH